VAFEPRGFEGTALVRIVAVLKLPVRFEVVALSDRDGEATMRSIADIGGSSTIESANTLSYSIATSVVESRVRSATLDSYRLENVGFIKIDVEGHENSVLRGGTETISKSRCNLLIECEERHAPGAIDTLFAFAAALDYRGFFLMDGKLRHISEFELHLHQRRENLGDWRDGWKRHGIYINNFIFVPAERSRSFETECAKLLD
jgi:FkbM family methyltransferase